MKKTILALLLVSMGTPTLAAIIVPARAVVIAHPVATAKPTVATKPANTYKPVPRAPVYIPPVLLSKCHKNKACK